MNSIKELSVKDVMKTKDLVTVQPKMLARDASVLFAQYNITGAPVVNEHGELIGSVSMNDLARSEAIIDLKGVLELVFFNASDDIKKMVNEHLRENYSEIDVYYIMTLNPITVTPDEKLKKVIELLTENKIHRVFVIDSKKLVGIITVTDILKLIMQHN